MSTVTSEDFFSGTSAALAGGTTSIIDFVTPEPGRWLLQAWHARRAEAVNRVVALAGLLCAPVYIVHVSSAEAAAAIIRARSAGQRVDGEVLAQHLLIDESVYRDVDWGGAAAHVMSPPFRAKHDRAALWAGLVAGQLQATASDHCCFRGDQKAAGLSDFTRIPNGTGGMEDRMSVLWHHGVCTGRLTPMEFVRVTSTNAAHIINLYPRKGAVRCGSDADLVVCDAQASRTVSARTHHQNVDFNVYEGMRMTGLARHTISRGSLVWTNGDLRAVRGAGRYVERPCSPAPLSRAGRNASVHSRRP